MPQYELDAVGRHEVSARTRGRTPEEAVRRAAGLPDDADLAVDAEADLHGWHVVRLEGKAAGRVRLHQRMQFRRD